MARFQWHKIYATTVGAPPELLFRLLSDLPNYADWLPQSGQYGRTTDVEPYPVRLGSRYHDGKPEEPGRSWLGTVTGFQPPGSLDFHQTITARQLLATIDVHIHYSIEPVGAGTLVSRWQVLDIDMPFFFRPLRPLIVSAFDIENRRTMAALAEYAGTHADELADE